MVLQLLERTRADAAWRKIHDAKKCAIVVRCSKQAQIGQCVLHFRALEKAHAAVDAVRQRGIEQRVLEDARLRVAAIKQRDGIERNAVLRQTLHDIDDECGLVQVRWRNEGTHGLAAAFVRPQVLAEPQAVVLDERVRGIENIAVRPIVLLELDQRHRALCGREIALEVLHVGDVRAAKRVNRLIVVAHGEYGGIRAGEEAQPFVLQNIRILEFVDQDMREASAVIFANQLL